MYCKKCGNPLKDTDNFCDVCGEPTTAQESTTYAPKKPDLTKKEFLNMYATPSLKTQLTVIAVLGYVFAGINFISVLTVTVFSLIDFGIILGTTLGIHLKQSRGCAIGLLVFGGLSCLIGLVSFGSPTGWGILAVGIWALVVTNKLDAEYNNYRSSL